MLLKSKILLPRNIFHRDWKSENWNWRINLLFNARGLKLGHFGIFDMLFSFLAFFKL